MLVLHHPALESQDSMSQDAATPFFWAPLLLPLSLSVFVFLLIPPVSLL